MAYGGIYKAFEEEIIRLYNVENLSLARINMVFIDRSEGHRYHEIPSKFVIRYILKINGFLSSGPPYHDHTALMCRDRNIWEAYKAGVSPRGIFM